MLPVSNMLRAVETLPRTLPEGCMRLAPERIAVIITCDRYESAAGVAYPTSSSNRAYLPPSPRQHPTAKHGKQKKSKAVHMW